MDDKDNLQLFSQYPKLKEKLPWLKIANLPTPVEKLENLGRELGACDLWIKRDDLNSGLYSGNKPRKLEFIFALAKKRGQDQIITLGGAGSNHAVATCLHGKEQGFSPILYLSDQPVLSYVRRNLLINQFCNAKMIYSPNEVVSVLKVIGRYIRDFVRGAPRPYFMWFGGSGPIGNTGFVEAGLELAAQVKAGHLPKPRRIFLPTGSCGTHAGLLVGLRAAGLDTEIVGIRVVPKPVTNRYVVAYHANKVARFLKRLSPAFPTIKVSPSQIHLVDDFFGGQYGRPSKEGKEAMKIAKEYENINLDPTYTSKAFAAMLHFIKKDGIGSEPILFWHTYNRVDLSEYAKGEPSVEMHEKLKRYFTAPLYDPEL